MSKDIAITITPIWAIIEHVRKRVKTELGPEVAPDTLDATIICASELCENAIKYGDAVSQMQFIQFLLKKEGPSIEITVSNGVTSPSDLEAVTMYIERINQSSNPEQLYLERLKELMENSGQEKIRLGLYRIAHETGFKLNCTSEHEVISITAKLNIL